jgi:hypothetical protein
MRTILAAVEEITMRRTFRRLSVILAISTFCAGFAIAADPPSSAKSPAAKPASKMTLGQGVELLPHAYQGPFVRMPDGAILGIDQNQVIRSTDEGATWTKSEISPPGNKPSLTSTSATSGPFCSPATARSCSVA